MASRRQAREHALQVLFQLDMTGDTPDSALELHWPDVKVDPKTREFAEMVVRGAWADVVRIDALIEASSENWRIARMATVDRNVIRMAVFELLHEPDTPPAVVLDEAIEIARKFGGEESGQFVNGVLDAVRRQIQAAPPPLVDPVGKPNRSA